MRRVVAAVSETTMRTNRPVFACSACWLLKRNAYPVAWAAASATVRKRVYCVILA